MSPFGPLRLGVNIDHVATVRNARGGRHPDPVRAALLAIEAGADDVESDEEGHTIYCAFENLGEVSKALETALGEAESVKRRVLAEQLGRKLADELHLNDPVEEARSKRKARNAKRGEEA